MFRPTTLLIPMIALTTAFGGCRCTENIAIKSTSEILKRAQPSMKMESSYEMARRALPGALKTVEGFHVALPSNEALYPVLAEGYCQFASGFVEDEWEQALFAGKFDVAKSRERWATKMYVRCMNYAFMMLPSKWKKNLFKSAADAKKLVDGATWSDRDGMQWLTVALASSINHNTGNAELLLQIPVVEMMLKKLIEMDDKHNQKDPMKRALPLMITGMLHTAKPKALGGRPDLAKKAFERVFKIAPKFLLAKVYYASRYAKSIQDRKLFRDTLIEVLQTSPAIWPEQRLANEIAHRRARRYLKMEKEWF